VLILAMSFRDIVVNSSADNKPSLQEDMDANLKTDRSVFDEEDPDSKMDDMTDFDDIDTNDKSDSFHEDEPSPDQFTIKKIPKLKMKGNQQVLKFRFCFSCGYRNMFDQYSAMINQRYPDIKIVGENYNPVAWKLYLTQFLSSFKILVIGFIIFGYNPFQYLNLETPAIFNWAVENKLYASMMIFFISNAIETSLISTGAFEIFLNDMQIWSKLQSDRMPHEKELLQMIDMNFNFDQEKNGFSPPNDGNFRI